MQYFLLNLFVGSPTGCATLKNSGGIKVIGCGWKTAPFKSTTQTTTVQFKLPKFRRPHNPRPQQEANTTDLNSTTTITPDENNVQHMDSTVVTLSIGEIYLLP